MTDPREILSRALGASLYAAGAYPARFRQRLEEPPPRPRRVAPAPRPAPADWTPPVSLKKAPHPFASELAVLAELAELTKATGSPLAAAQHLFGAPSRMRDAA